MRLNHDAGKTRRLRSDSGHDGEKVEIGMSTPSMRIRPRRFWLLRPSRKPECNHILPRLEQIRIPVSQTCVVQSTRQIEAEVIGGVRHIWHWARSRKAQISGRKNFRENIFLLFGWDYVEPHAKNVGMLAVVFLGWSIRD